MYHSNATDSWDIWENERFEEHWTDAIAYYSQLSSFARRHVKLWSKRQHNKTYCNKSERNYLKHSNGMKLRFKYCGKKYL